MPDHAISSPLKILLVDDEARLRSVLRSFLELANHTVHDVEDGQAAIDLLGKENFDLVISDINMPNLSGMDVLKWTKNSNFRDPGVILISGMEDVSTPEALDAGAEDLMLKPVDCDTFLSAVDKARIRPQNRWGAPEEESHSPARTLEFKLQSFETALATGIFEFGQGGMFLHLESAFPMSYERINFDFNFAEGDLREFTGHGVVRWSRPFGTQGLRSGCGIEFIQIHPDAIKTVTQLVDASKTKSFIPLGRVISPK